MLISDLIDKVLGYSYHQYIKEEFLIPLGLKNIFGSIHEVNIDDVMNGYYVDMKRIKKQTLQAWWSLLLKMWESLLEH